ncbi:hypothetical protein ACIPMU_36955 [Streptomyces cyaneofuscatus]|uniref:hypothetical protein n=1 Tax=Streptomyces cyaneofuscatus TaxID=66883 RepID=UPI003815DA15
MKQAGQVPPYAARSDPRGSGTAFLAAVFFAAGFSPPAFFLAACARRDASRCALPGRFFGCCPRAA